MTKFIEVLAMVLGGSSLFAVCFLGFSVMSGRPIGQVPFFGNLAQSTVHVAPVTTDPAAPRSPDKTPTVEPRTSNQVVHAGIGVMGAWNLPSPYSQIELRALADELKLKLTQLDAREAAAAERERQNEERTRELANQFEALERLRNGFESLEHELDLREQEVVRDEETADQRATLKWQEMGKVFADLDAEVAATRLISYEPTDAARILLGMDETTATSILNAIPDRWKEYLDAYTEIAAGSSRP
jgi:hypothetical protein